jgi:hypothetical protein
VKQMDFVFEELGKKIGDINDQFSHLNYNRPRGDDPEKLDYYLASRAKDAIDRAVARFQKNLKTEANRHWKQREPTRIEFPSVSPEPSSQFTSLSYTGHKPPANRSNEPSE